MRGIGVSPGISIGPAFVVRKTMKAFSGIVLESEELKREEIDLFDKAVIASVAEIEEMKGNNNQVIHKTLIDILDTQIEFLTDPQIRTDVLEKINNENRSASDAVIEVIETSAAIFESIDDEYLRARVSDIRDIGNRILRNLESSNEQVSAELPENAILISDDITPSDTISIDVTRIAGFATKAGGRTSHSAIIARSRGIPAVVGCGDELMEISNNTLVIIDGATGDIIINPDQVTLGLYTVKKKNESREKALLEKLKDLPAITRDGMKINLYGNIAGAGDLEKVFENGGEGVGLFRTELLFMDRKSLPDEEEQFEFYKEAAVRSNNMPVIIRTLDIGGDKQLSYIDIPAESNPFMGYRAIRFCLGNKDIFLTQIRAILRAGAFGNLKIMFPMISNISEIREAKECLQQAKNDLTKSGTDFRNDIETGIMIEIPAAALVADQLAQEVDFFSIGTNDLCQYTLAVDRMNEKVAPLYNHFNPGVLRLIQYTIEQARKYKIHVGLCGEMASDPLATRLLMGMGLEDFSMGAASIPSIKNIIINTEMSKAIEVRNRVQEMNNSEDITDYLKEASI
jgi:phosphoenolpyruvate-protein phosphotransferase (PTS system enzyme I)